MRGAMAPERAQGRRRVSREAQLVLVSGSRCRGCFERVLGFSRRSDGGTSGAYVAAGRGDDCPVADRRPGRRDDSADNGADHRADGCRESNCSGNADDRGGAGNGCRDARSADGGQYPGRRWAGRRGV